MFVIVHKLREGTSPTQRETEICESAEKEKEKEKKKKRLN